MGLIPETAAAERAGAVLRRFVASPYLTDQFWTELGGKAIANRGALAAIFAEYEADPTRLDANRDRVQLRQQQTATLDFEGDLAERLWENKREREALEAMFEKVRRGHSDTYNVDEREQDREDAKRREQRQDEHAEAPRGIAS